MNAKTYDCSLYTIRHIQLHNHISTSLISSLCILLFRSVQEKCIYLCSVPTHFSAKKMQIHMQQFSAETSEVQGLQSKISPVTQQPSSLVGADRGSPAAGPVTTEMHFWKPPPPQAWNPWALLSFLLSPWEHQQKQHSSQLLRPMFSTYWQNTWQRQCSGLHRRYYQKKIKLIY